MGKRFLAFIGRLIGPVRLYLNKIRENNPGRFDTLSKAVTFAIPFLSCFAPALVTNNWSRAILEFVVLTIILVFQWSTLTNRIVEKNKELEKTKETNKVLNQEIKEKSALIDKLAEDDINLTKLFGDEEKQYKKSIAVLNKHLDDLAGFSHSVSDNVKKLTAEIQEPFDAKVVFKITQFLQLSLNSLESILSDHYGLEIRTSIKFTVDDNTVKTYARGRNNIFSRGGEYRCSQLNEKAIKIEENYAYIAIAWMEQQFFAEGNLLELHNKFEEDDVFFCEYGDEYLDIFCSTIVMPIRIPVYASLITDQQEPAQEILGLLCIDCKTEIPEWSMEDIKDQRAYHIIADYADSLALLLKEYRDASGQ